MKKIKNETVAKKRKVYFSKETQQHITEYIQEKDTVKKNYIYKTYIQVAFDKLVENTINNNSFPYIKEKYDDIHHEVIYHLLTVIGGYDEKLGRAFAYFGTIAKNYLVAWNDREYKESKRMSDLDVVDYNRNIHSEIASEIRNEDMEKISEYLIKYFINNLDIIFKKKRDMDILNAIVVLIERREFIDNFNKKSLYIRIRELTGYKTHYITKVVNKIKPIYKNLIKEFYRTGTIITKKKNKFV